MRASTKLKIRAAATWSLLYFYSASALVGCAPSPQGNTSEPDPIARNRYALPSGFLTSYQLSTPQADGSNGGLRGQTSFSHRVSPDGEFQLDVPLSTPPGRNGVEPHLSLSYGHRRGDGFVGHKWGLSGLARVHRCSKSKSFDGEWGDQAGSELCLNGQRVIQLGTSGGLQTLDGDSKITVLPSTTGGTIPRGYSSKRRDGTTTEFTFSPGASTNPSEFLQTSQKDPWGNEMRFDYNVDGSPSTISYTSNSTTAANRFVDFAYEARSGSKPSRASGGEILVQSTRLKTITMAAPGNLSGAVKIVRRYKLAYSDDTISTVTECIPSLHQWDRTQTPTERCYDPVVLNYQSAPVAFGQKQPIGEVAEFPQIFDVRKDTSNTDGLFANSLAQHLKSLAVLDVDGDGILDLVYMKVASTTYVSVGRCQNGPVIQGRWFWRQGRGIASSPAFAAEADLGFGDLTLEGAGYPPRAVDVDGDGVFEVLAGVTSACHNLTNPTLVSRSLNLAIHSKQTNGTWLPVTSFPAASLLGDVNGDGLSDVTFLQPERFRFVGTQVGSVSGPLAIKLNTSSPGQPSFGSASSLLPLSPCHEVPPSPIAQWAGSVTCKPPDISCSGTSCYLTPGTVETPCNHCATDALLRTVPGCSSDCAVTGYVMSDTPSTSTTTGSRVSSVAQSALVDLDGNGVLEPVFREAVPAHDIRYGVSGYLSLSDGLYFGVANDGNDAPVVPELPGKAYYAARFGGGAFTRHRLNASETIPLQYHQPERTRFVDMNADGLPDLLGVSSTRLIAQLNTGGGVFGPALVFDLTTTGIPNGPVDLVFDSFLRNIGDVDGDGRPEVLLASSSRMFDIDGAEWRERAITLPRGSGAILKYAQNGALVNTGLVSDFNEIFVDVDNDGIADAIGINQFVDVAGGETQQPRIYVSRNSAKRKFLTGAASGPRSVSVQTERYQAPSVACTYPQSCATPDGLYVAASTTETDVDAQGLVVRYAYEGSRTDLLGGGWLGFSRRLITISTKGVVRDESYANTWQDRATSAACTGCYWYPGANRLSSVVTTRDSRRDSGVATGQVIKSSEQFVYEDQRGSTSSPLVSYLKRYAVTERVKTLTAGLSSPATFVAAKSRLVTAVQSNGTLTAQRFEDWEGEALANGDPPAGVATKWTEQSTTLLADDTAYWLVGLPYRVTTRSQWPGTPIAARVIEFSYLANKPILASVTVEPDSITVEGVSTSGYKIKTELTRDSQYGTVERVTESGLWLPYDQTAATVRTRISSLTYDSDWIFPRTSTNPLQQSVELYFLPSTGALVASSKDIGGSTLDHQIDLDTAGRAVRISETGSPTETVSYFSDRVETDDVVSGTTKAYFDEFGRPLRTESIGWNGTTVKQTYAYHAEGQLQSVSLPYKTRPEYISYGYDGLGRLISQTNSGTGEQELLKYEAAAAPFSWKTTSVNQAGAEHEVFTDAVGSQLRLKELISRSTSCPPGQICTNEFAEQNFSYGAFGLLSGIQDAAQHWVTFEYDKIGRQVRIVDPDSGTREMRYSAFGELSRVQSPLDVIEFKRDALSRVVKRRTTAASGMPTEATFVWDSAPNAVGQLVSSVSDTSVTHGFTYNASGLAAAESWTVGGQAYATGMQYDQYSRLQYLTFPAMGAGTPATRVKYVYGTDGRVERVEDASSTSSTRIFWSVLERNAAGLVTSSQSGATTGLPTIGSNMLTKYIYDGGNRLTHIDVSDLQRASLLALRYEYGLSGIKARHDRSQPGNFVSEEFGHDLAGRLTDWTLHQGNGAVCSVGSRTHYKYSQTGNLEREEFLDAAGNTVGTPKVSTYGGNAKPSAIDSRSEGGLTTIFGADSNGNQSSSTTGGSLDRLTSFLPDGQLATAQSALGSWRMDYDALGDRVRVQKLSPGGQPIPGADTLELGGQIARHPDGRLSFNIVVDGQVVAVVSKSASSGTWSDEVRYVYSDLLGSPSVIASESGNVLDRPHYDPFGERRDNTNMNLRSGVRHPERLGFAAHVPDDDWNSIKMGARSFDPKTTRFLSPDPLYSSGQQLNAYAYAQNSPINNVDPSGLNCIATNGAGASFWACGSGGGASPSSAPAFAPASSPNEREGAFMAGVDGARGLGQAVVDDTNRLEPTKATAGQAAIAFGTGFLKGAAWGVGTAYALGAVSALCPPCAVGVGIGLLAYGVYGLVNGGAVAIVASGARVFSGEGTAEDFEMGGTLVGGIVAGRLGKAAYGQGLKGGQALKGAGMRLLRPTSGCIAGCLRPGWRTGCFAEGTEVVTSEGPRTIESIAVGDRVASFDFEANQTVLAVVSKVISGVTDHWVVVGLDGIRLPMKATPSHPFWSRTKGQWVRADQLQVEESLAGPSGQVLTVISLANERAIGSARGTYNLVVDGHHNYFANGVLVHNGEGGYGPWQLHSPGYPDFVMKGLHFYHPNGTELSVRPGTGGSVVFKPVFGSETSAQGAKAIAEAARRFATNPAWKADIRDTAQSAISTISGHPPTPQAQGKGFEMKLLVKACE